MPRLACLILMLLTVSPVAAATYSGTVTDSAGHAVAGAEVAFVFSNRERIEAASTTTNEAGNFAVEHEAVASSPFMGSYAVYKPGLALAGGIIKRDPMTVVLAPPAAARGLVLDADGKPASDVGVALQTVFFAEPRSYISLQRSPLAARFATRTGADGTWTINDLPANGQAKIGLEDVRYAHTYGTVVVGAGPGETKPLVARPAAQLCGRVVGGDGKPARAIKVNAASRTGDWGEAQTGDDGTYKIDSLGPGAYDVGVTDPSHDWVAVAARCVVAAGTRCDAPDLVLTRGALIEGTVSDAATGKPIAGALIGGSGPNSPRESGLGTANAISDAEGHFTLRMAPGKVVVYIMGTVDDYLPPEQTAPYSHYDITLKQDEQPRLDFRLKKGETLRGKAVNGLGEPVPGALIRIGVHDWDAKTATTDAKGTFAITGLRPGDYALDGGEAWDIIKPVKVTVPALDAVRVTVQKSQFTPSFGRVVTRDGRPLAGVAINMEIATSRGEGGTVSYKNQTTGADGRFPLPRLRPNQTVTLKATRQGYKAASIGKVESRNGSSSASDTVMEALDASITGRVTDSAGVPRAGVTVLALEGIPGSRSTTDANGNFTLTGLPHGNVNLVAVDRTGHGGLRATTEKRPLELQLMPTGTKAPARDLERGFAVLEETFRESAATGYYARSNILSEIAAYDAPRALKLAAAPDGSYEDMVLGNILHAAILADPKATATWAPPYFQKMTDPSLRRYMEVFVAQDWVDTRPELAFEIYNRARAALPAANLAAPTAQLAELAMPSCGVAMLGLRLHEPQARQLAEQALALGQAYTRKADKEHAVPGMLAALVEGLATADLDMALELTKEVPAGERRDGFSRAMAPLAARDSEAARRLLDAIVRLPAGGETEGYSNQQADFAFGQSATALIRAIGKDEPATALALARKVQNPSYRAMALALAAQFQVPEVAAKLFREAIGCVSPSDRPVEQMARIAAMAYDIDPKLGQDLFTLAKQAAADENHYPGGVAALAFYYARVNLGESRVWLETELVQRLQARQANDPRTTVGNVTFDDWYVGDIVRAMAAVDPERALEIASTMTKPDLRFDAVRKIGQYMIATEAVRHTMAFEHWGASDTWQPDRRGVW